MRATLPRAMGVAIIWALSTPSVGAPLGPAPEPARTAESERAGAPASAEPERAGPEDTSALPIGRPRDTQGTQSPDDGSGDDASSVLAIPGGMVRTVAALGGVLALIFALAHTARRIARSRGGLAARMGAGGAAPSGVVDVLGRYPLQRGHTLVVLRFGRRVILASNSGGARRGAPAHMQTLCELDDPDEIASIMRTIGDARGDSGAAEFERTLHEAGGATDEAIGQALRAQHDAVSMQRTHASGPRRTPPGVYSNDEGDRLELTSSYDGSAVGHALRRRLGALRRGGGA